MEDTSSPALSRNISATSRAIARQRRRIMARLPTAGRPPRRPPSAPRSIGAGAICKASRGVIVATRSSKKQAILECRQKYCPERAGIRELRLIQRELGERLGGSSPPALSYIANVLRQAGTAVEYEDRYVDPALPEPYASRLEGALRFNDLAAAE